jgi:hypothetical protein
VHRLNARPTSNKWPPVAPSAKSQGRVASRCEKRFSEALTIGHSTHQVDQARGGDSGSPHSAWVSAVDKPGHAARWPKTWFTGRELQRSLGSADFAMGRKPGLKGTQQSQLHSVLSADSKPRITLKWSAPSMGRNVLALPCVPQAACITALWRANSDVSSPPR